MSQPLADRRHLILASTSPFRRELLARLALPFEIIAPNIDETPLPHETPQALVARLAEQKAQAIAVRQCGALVIGCDQIAVLEGKIIGKPGDHKQAVIQLTRASGKTMTFYTGLCLIDSDSDRRQVEVVPFRVVLRTLTSQQIERYLQREKPYNCAGSFRSEGLGIALFERLIGDDPSSLIGLPLICLTRMLEAEGIAVL